MKKKIFRGIASLAAAVGVLSLNPMIAKAAIPNNIILYYTQGAPSSCTCTYSSFEYTACGNSSTVLRISNFSNPDPYIKINTTPALSTRYYYGVTNGYIEVPYANGASTIRGSMVPTNVTLYNYSNCGSCAVYGVITEADG
ncbi:hypothetical protein [Anaeromicropila populeti]|uniref:Uncharacterized protein n=1 Tax=Anaeromicropila populeti TaxID=37658 RepID=A0A1I6HQN2_9FIRM|nr:hypothetical protein [Anaeromicropila populeti]SFR56765.1 hypothetical protein SAMN05661086_00174 [Anaeromicropila populeti]